MDLNYPTSKEVVKSQVDFKIYGMLFSKPRSQLKMIYDN